MDVEVVWGTGSATSSLGAFDAALAEAGIHNYNLVELSSVIPSGARVKPAGRHNQRFSVGDAVGIVLAKAASQEPEAPIAAGLGWAIGAEGGIFMEATGETEADCEEQLRRSLEDARETRDWTWKGKEHIQVVEHRVEDVDAAIVAAVYGPLARWED